MTVHRDWWLRRTYSQQTDETGKRGGSRRRDLWGPTAVRQPPRESRRAMFACVKRQEKTSACVSVASCAWCADVSRTIGDAVRPGCSLLVLDTPPPLMT